MLHTFDFSTQRSFTKNDLTISYQFLTHGDRYGLQRKVTGYKESITEKLILCHSFSQKFSGAREALGSEIPVIADEEAINMPPTTGK